MPFGTFLSTAVMTAFLWFFNLKDKKRKGGLNISGEDDTHHNPESSSLSHQRKLELFFIRGAVSPRTTRYTTHSLLLEPCENLWLCFNVWINVCVCVCDSMSQFLSLPFIRKGRSLWAWQTHSFVLCCVPYLWQNQVSNPRKSSKTDSPSSMGRMCVLHDSSKGRRRGSQTHSEQKNRKLAREQSRWSRNRHT